MNVSNKDNLFYEANFTASLVCTALNDIFNLGINKNIIVIQTYHKNLKKLFNWIIKSRIKYLHFIKFQFSI